MQTSMSRVFDFQKQLNIGELAEAHLDKHFSRTHEVRKATLAEQKTGIDRFLRRKGSNDPAAWTAVEYKADWRAGETGCFFLEQSHSSGIDGWVQSTAADWLVMFIPYTGALYFVEPHKLRALADSQRWKVGWSQNKTYRTKGILLPIGELAKIGKFQLIERMEI